MNFTQMLYQLFDKKKAVSRVDAFGHYVSWYLKIDQKTKTINMLFKIDNAIGIHNYEFEYLDMESEWEIYQDDYIPRYKAVFDKTIQYNFDYVIELLKEMDASGWFQDDIFFESAKALCVHKKRPMAALEKLIDNKFLNCSISIYDERLKLYKKVIEKNGLNTEYCQKLLHDNRYDFEEYLADRLKYYKRENDMKGGK